MTLADALKPRLRAIRAIPGDKGLRPHRVFLRRKIFPGENDAENRVTFTEQEIVEARNRPPKVRQLGDERRALAALAAGSIEIGPCTTQGSDGGIAFETLQGLALERDEMFLVRIQGPTGNHLYAIKGLTIDRAMHYRIVCEPVASIETDDE